jgi:hypothetical protein
MGLDGDIISQIQRNQKDNKEILKNFQRKENHSRLIMPHNKVEI